MRHDQLKELVKSGRIDAYEVIGREVVLYWRYIKAKDKFELPLSLIAAVPGGLVTLDYPSYRITESPGNSRIDFVQRRRRVAGVLTSQLR